MDGNYLLKRVNPSLFYTLLDPFFYNDLQSKMNRQKLPTKLKHSVKQQSASCEDILTKDPPAVQRMFTNDTCSLDLLQGAEHCPIDTPLVFKPTDQANSTITNPVALLSDIINYLMNSLVPCIRCIGTVQYNARCFYGYEAVSALTVYIQDSTVGMGPPFPVDKIPIICSRFLVSGVIKDARKSQNLEFKSSKLYRFSSMYIHNHAQLLLDELAHEVSSTTTMHTTSSSSDQVISKPNRPAAFTFSNCKAKLQSLAKSITSSPTWINRGQRHSGSESDSGRGLNHHGNGWTSLSEDDIISNPITTSSITSTRHEEHMVDHCTFTFSRKGYPSVDIPLHKPRQMNKQPHDRPLLYSSQTCSSTNTEQTLGQDKRSASFSTLTSNHSSSTISLQQVDRDNNKQWVVYGFI